MRYSAEPKYRKYAKEHGFCDLQKRTVINRVKN